MADLVGNTPAKTTLERNQTDMSTEIFHLISDKLNAKYHQDNSALKASHWQLIINISSRSDKREVAISNFKSFDFYLSHFIHAFCLFTSIYNVHLNYASATAVF